MSEKEFLSDNVDKMSVVAINRSGLVAALLVLCPLTWHSAPNAQTAITAARPIIELEKARFASNEVVFFWIGVVAPEGYRIPANLWTTCRLTITRPDGIQRTADGGWPVDGALDRGWRGGHRVGPEPLQIGRYIVVFEFAGQKTSPYSFTVEDVPILNDITAEFLYSSPLVLGSSDTAATLVVRNGSNQTIRFPHRGVMSHVWVRLNKTNGERWASSFPIPQPILVGAAGIKPSTVGGDTFTWTLSEMVPTVALAPGDSYRLSLPLSAILREYGGQPIPDGEYDVELFTTVEIIVGERDSQWADFAPFRMDVTSVGHGTYLR